MSGSEKHKPLFQYSVSTFYFDLLFMSSCAAQFASFLKIRSNELSCGCIMSVPFFAIFTVFCFIQEAGNQPNQATAPTDEPSSVTRGAAIHPERRAGQQVDGQGNKAGSWALHTPVGSVHPGMHTSSAGSQQGHTVVTCCGSSRHKQMFCG